MNDFTFRPATADDFELHCRLVPELEVDDPPPVRERWIADQAPLTLVAERDGRAVGTLYWQLLEGSGYVRQVVVERAARRTGAGRALMNEVRRRLREANCATWRLNVKPHNVPAVRLYESLGMQRQYSSASYWVTQATLPLLPRSPVAATLLGPVDDERWEQRFGLPRGQLAEARAHHRVLLQVGEAGGFCVFSPNFPGSFPFRVNELSAASALISAMWAHAPHGAPRLGLVVEGDERLQRALDAAGAPLRMAFDHYAGPV